MPPPPIWAARPVHEAGNTTRKLIARPCELLSIGAIAPSIEQYAGALAVLTHLGAARVTPATGSPMADAGIVGSEPFTRAVFRGDHLRSLGSGTLGSLRLNPAVA